MASDPMTDSNGFVTNAFFQGSVRKIREVCTILGIPEPRATTRTLRISIFAEDRIRPEALARAERFWNAD